MAMQTNSNDAIQRLKQLHLSQLITLSLVAALAAGCGGKDPALPNEASSVPLSNGASNPTTPPAPTSPTTPISPTSPASAPTPPASSPTPPASAPPPPPVATTPFQPAPVQARVLLSGQYKNAVNDLLGQAAANAVTPLEDTLLNGSSAVGSSTLSLSRTAIERYEKNALDAAKAALADKAFRAKLVPCTATGATDDACMSTVVSSFGARAFRRALTADELSTWKAVAKSAASSYSSFDKGVEFAIAGMLQSPQFLYITEQGEPDAQRGGMLRYTSTEMASRLSFFLLGTTPPDALLASAAKGELASADGVRAQAKALLDMPQARTALNTWFAEWLSLSDLATAGKDNTLYPAYDAALAASMKEESLQLFNAVATDAKRSFLDIFDANFSFVDPALAKHYGITAPSASGFARVDWPAGSPRLGMLTQAAFLSVMAHPVDTSPTLRGKLIRERMLCQPIGAPPPDVITSLTPAPGAPPKTVRERLQQHAIEPRCQGCHSQMDPIGLGFEQFDAVGRFRTTENNMTVDASGSLDKAGSFKDAHGLAALLKADARVPLCITRSVFRHAAAHVEQAGEEPSLQAVEKAARTQGFNMRALLVELVASDAFRYTTR
jgi:Protein of unknown function (DUF1592)/Protein of unknown function (DUF1588)/Protein of unknown function (DUF1595)/Protein of unknown function (DUF1585)